MLKWRDVRRIRILWKRDEEEKGISNIQYWILNVEVARCSKNLNSPKTRWRRKRNIEYPIQNFECWSGSMFDESEFSENEMKKKKEYRISNKACPERSRRESRMLKWRDVRWIRILRKRRKNCALLFAPCSLRLALCALLFARCALHFSLHYSIFNILRFNIPLSLNALRHALCALPF